MAEKKTGFFNGLGYIGERIGLGFMQSVEGIWDFAAGGIADLFGNEEYAERQFENQWFKDWYNSAGDWYEADGAWKIAGDVASGIGSTLPALGTAIGAGLAVYFSGGTAAPIALKAVAAAASPLVAGLGAAGTATKEAYDKTGKLTSEEYGYGALTGLTEGAIEGVTNMVGLGAGSVYKGLTKGAGKAAVKGATEIAAKQTVKSLSAKVAKSVAGSFASEAFEEGFAELVAPQYARWTYDPSAEYATAEEIAYASLVGGLAGVIMTGAGNVTSKGITTVANAESGKKIIEAGQTEEVMSAAKAVADAVANGESEYDLFGRISNIYNSISTTDTYVGKAKLGELRRLLAASRVLPSVEQSAMGIIENPQAAIEAYGLKNEDGTAITPEALIDGVKTEGTAKEKMASLRRAISNNRLLGSLAIADAMGKLLINTDTYANAVQMGNLMGGRRQFNSFKERASAEQKAAIASMLGLPSLDAVDYNTFVERMSAYASTPEGGAKIASARAYKESARNIPENNKAIPNTVSAALADGIHRFGGKNGIAVIKEGDTVRIYDYSTGNISRAMTVAEANMALQKHRRAALPETTTKSDETTAKKEETTTKSEVKTDDIAAFAKENVEGYKNLTPNEQSEIRAMIRQAKALGIPDADIKTYARVSARSGVRVVFSKDRNAVTYKDGTKVFADGYYDPKTNEIVVNPEGKRSPTKLLVHELSHALYSYKKYRTILDREVKNMDEERANDVAARYRNAGESVEVTSEELAVHHAEDVLGHKNTLERVLMEEPNIKSKILSFFRVAKSAYQGDERLSRAAGRLYERFEKAFNDFADANRARLSEEISEARMRGDDARFSLQFADNIADNQRSYLDSHKKHITDDELTKAIDDTAEMVKAMLPHKDILPTDVTGKKGSTLVKNGSYDVSVENTTVCIRTLSYNAFTDMVSEKIGRPLSQMESFLVSQKLYDIAKEPQCLYCYVSLDRKAFNEMIIRYTEQRDATIKAWEDAGKPELKQPKIVDGKVVGEHPYKTFLAGRKHTDNMWKRYNEWISAAKSGEKLITLADVATESRRADIAQNGTASQKAQIADMLKYAQSASWAKKQTKYVAYYDDILRLSPKAVKDLNKHYGLRWYSFSDYSGAFIVENMQQVTDASLRGLKGLSYTKDVDFARIFAPTGMNINISVYATDINGKWEIDPKQSADIDAAIDLRKQYPNVGIVVVAAKREGVEWALAQEWSDVVIPFHIVRSGQDVANFYDWEVFNSEQGDTVMDENLWSQYVESLGNPKKVSKSIYPSEHQNSRATYLALCEERGIKPRFSSFLDNPNYMKLVNETRQREADTMPLRPTFDLGAAEKSFDRFVKKGGYYEGWYNDGVDISTEVDTVAADVLAGKKANEVSYGRQDKQGNPIPTPDELMASRKANRSHGRRMALPDDTTYLSAVNRGDMETAQKMVDEAAKAAGYDSPKLYHGTGKFGFTEFDPSMSDDRLSFFVSNNPSVSATYSGGGEVRTIASRPDITPEGLENASPAQILKLLKENVDDSYKIISEKEHEKLVEKHRDGIDYAIHVASHIGDAMPVSEKASAILEKMVSDLEAMRAADDYGAFMDAYNEFDGDKWDLKWEDDRLFEAINIVTYEEIASAYSGLTNILGNVLFETGKADSGYITKEEAFTLLYGSLFKGIYQLYSNTGKQFVVDAAGENWNSIDGKNIEAEGPVRTRDVAKYAHDNGYDSVIIKDVRDNGDITFGGFGDVYIFFGSHRLKSADPVTYDDNGNIIPLSQRFNPKHSDIRRALPDTTFDPVAIAERGLPLRGQGLTVGQAAKLRANLIHEKVFTRKQAMEIVSKFAGIAELKGKTVNEITDAVWTALNVTDTPEARTAAAQSIAEYIVAKMYLESETLSPDAQSAADRLDYLRMGIGSLSFTKADLSEIKHKVDAAGQRAILGRWGYKGGKKVKTPMDVFVADIARQMPNAEYLEDMPPIDAFMEIVDMYDSALSTAGEKVSAFEDVPPEAMLEGVSGIREEILRAYNESGDKSRKTYFIRSLERKIEDYRSRLSHSTLRGRIIDKAQKLRDMKIGKFANATQAENDQIVSSIGALGRIKWRGTMSPNAARTAFAKVAEWYRKDNPVLLWTEEDPGVYYSEDVETALHELSETSGVFSEEEMNTIDQLLGYFIWLGENYSKVWRTATGQWEDVADISKRYVDDIRRHKATKVPLFGKIAGSAYAEMFNDPMSVARRMDMYEDGFYSEIMEGIRKGAMEAQIAEMNVRRPYEEFLKKHKNYLKKSRLGTVKYGDHDIPRITLVGLYMTYQRKHAWKGLAVNGFVYDSIDGKKRTQVKGTLTAEDALDAQVLEGYISGKVAEIKKLLTEADLEYVAILEKIYNDDAKRLKAERDYQRRGMTNASDDYYYPIRRFATKGKSIDEGSIQAELDRISNASFNKDTVKGASQALVIDPADAVLERHLPAVCSYAYLTPTLDYFKAVYNYDISGNKNFPVSVRTEAETYWKNGQSYLSELFEGAQGVRTSSSTTDKRISKALGTLRGGYAKYQLGANPKTWLSQLSSFVASTSILDMKNVMRGMTISSKDVYKYCPLAELRAYDNSAAMAMAVTDRKIGKAKEKVDKVGDVLMAPIGKVDGYVIGRLFGACQAQIESDGGAKIGTDENKKAAGKLLERVIFETQQGALATEKSAAMRSGSEFLRMITMFTSDAMKVVGRVIDGFGEVSVLRQKIKAETDPNAKAQLKKDLKGAGRRARKAAAALAMQAAFMVAIARFFKWLYNKDEEENEQGKMAADFIGNLLGGLPIISDVYSFFVDGYEIEDANYSAINDLLNSVKNTASIAADIAQGEDDPAARNRAIRNLAYSTGQVTGIPVRNIYNAFFGLTKRVSPTTAYGIDESFYKKNYESDLEKAIEKGDDKMAAYIFGLILGQKVDEEVDKTVYDELLGLAKKGYKVLPKTVDTTIKMEDEEYELTTEEENAIRADYTKSQIAIKKLVTSKVYKALDDEAKADVLDIAYKYLYEASESRVLGTSASKAALVSEMVGADVMAVFAYATKGIDNDTDKKGNVIEGSKRKKIVAIVNALNIPTEQKVMLLASKGYAVKDGDIRGVTAKSAKTMLQRYIVKSNLSKAEKEALAKACGFTVKNGVIVNK